MGASPLESGADGASIFAGKADAYRRHRVDYPAAMIEAALAAIALVPADRIADLGSGTGFLSRWLLERGNTVCGIEPERGMREVAAETLGHHGARFATREGTAEATGLAPGSVDVVTAGNAFHYFDPVRARQEVDRILRPGGRVLLVWHDLASRPNEFMTAYRAFIERLAPPRLRAVHDPDLTERGLATFFGSTPFADEDAGDHAFPLTREGLEGRFLSTSLAPREGAEERPRILAALAALFDRFQRDGTVELQLRWRFRWAVLAP